MKIALCLSGHFRKFEQTYPTLYFYLLKHYDCDIFIHTWDKLGFSCAFKTDATLNSTDSKLDEINKLYKPKKIIVESSHFVEELKKQGDEYAPHLKNVPKHVGHMASMFYKIYACNELRKSYQIQTGVKYDWIIRCRPDLIFHANVDLPKEKSLKSIWLPRDGGNLDWLSDQFAIATPDDMDLYSSFYFDMPEYFKAKMEYYPEKFMVWALKKKKLTVNWLDVYFNIYR